MDGALEYVGALTRFPFTGNGFVPNSGFCKRQCTEPTDCVKILTGVCCIPAHSNSVCKFASRYVCAILMRDLSQCDRRSTSNATCEKWLLLSQQIRPHLP